MDIVISVDDNVGALATAIGKMVGDVKRISRPGAPISGPGAPSVAGEVIALLGAAAQDLAPVIGAALSSKEAIKADKVKFALALLVEVEKALEL